MGDPFSILGLSPRFALGQTDLERRQRELYLERKGDGPEALEAINHAVRLLKDPAQRAEQIFRLRGWPVKGMPDPVLLERVFTDREFIDHARKRKDLQAIRAWIDAFRPRLKAIHAELSAILDAPIETPPPEPGTVAIGAVDPRDPRAARALLLLDELRYVGRAEAAAEAALVALSEED